MKQVNGTDTECQSSFKLSGFIEILTKDFTRVDRSL